MNTVTTATLPEDLQLLFADLDANKGDQVASMIKSCLKGWVDSENPWTTLCETFYERTNKGRTVNFAMFSNLSKAYGLENDEGPFFQIEIDTSSIKRVSMPGLPFGFGVAPQVIESPRLRDMAYPYLFILTILLRQRGCKPTALYQDAPAEPEKGLVEQPLRVDLFGGRAVWRVMLWQNRLIREYNRIIAIDPTFYMKPDDVAAVISKHAGVSEDDDVREPVDYRELPNKFA